MNSLAKAISLAVICCATIIESAALSTTHYTVYNRFYFGKRTGDDTLTIGWREALSDPISPLLYQLEMKSGDHLGGAPQVQPVEFLEKVNDDQDHFITIMFRGDVINLRESDFFFHSVPLSRHVYGIGVSKSAFFSDRATIGFVALTLPDAGSTLGMMALGLLPLLRMRKRAQ